MCVCTDIPDLCLEAVSGDPTLPKSGCGLTVGNTLVVEVHMSFSSSPVCGAQFFLEYDTDALEFQSMEPGGGVFSTELLEFVDQQSGTIDYLVGADPAGLCAGESGPAVIARISFVIVQACKSFGVRFRSHNPPTRLGSKSGGEVCPKGHFGPDGICGSLVSPCNTSELMLDGQAPSINCPTIETREFSDCGSVTKRVVWDPLSATDACQGSVPLECTVVNDRGINVDHLALSGGIFPIGTTTIHCKAVDNCLQVTTCDIQVQNTGFNGVVVDLEYSQPMSFGPLTRGIEFTLNDCRNLPSAAASRKCVDVNFGPPDQFPGMGRAVFSVAPRRYQCLEARDPLHTLRASCDLVCSDVQGVGQVWNTTMAGAPFAGNGCHWLINGNLDGVDPLVDARIGLGDFAVLQRFFGQARPIGSGSDTPCQAVTEDADLDGDGLVQLADYIMLFDHLLESDELDCNRICSPAGGPAAATSSAQILLGELQEMGLWASGQSADMNDDGIVDMADVVFLLDQQ